MYTVDLYKENLEDLINKGFNFRNYNEVVMVMIFFLDMMLISQLNMHSPLQN